MVHFMLWLGLLLMLLLLDWGCATAVAATTTVSIPPSFYQHIWESAVCVVDEEFITVEFAAPYCAENGNDTAVDAKLFFFGDLVMASIDAACAAGGNANNADDELVARLMGNGYMAGYTGGAYFRDVMRDIIQGNTAAAAAAVAGALPGTGRVVVPEDSEEELFYNLQDGIGAENALALQGDDGAVIAANEAAITSQVYSYGYNQGYLQAWTEHSPYPPSDPYGEFYCTSFFDCYVEGVELQTLATYNKSIAALESPTNARWRELNSTVARIGEPAFTVGYTLWSRVLQNKTIPFGVYELIYDLSARFLLVNDASVLSAMWSYAEQEGTPAGRCSILTRSGFTEWAFSYFLSILCLPTVPINNGFCMPYGEDSYPQLDCPI